MQHDKRTNKASMLSNKLGMSHTMNRDNMKHIQKKEKIKVNV